MRSWRARRGWRYRGTPYDSPPRRAGRSVPRTARAARRTDRGRPGICMAARPCSRCRCWLTARLEHYRGFIPEPGDVHPPLVVSGLTLGASVHGGADPRAATACATRSMCWRRRTGLIGTGFHLYNICKEPGGFCWQNLFYGAPLGAPMALCSPALSASPPSGCATPRRRDAAIFGLARRPGAGRRSPRRPAGHRGRGGAAAFPRRLS